MRKPLPFRALTVAGIMSGTSADGIDVAIVRITPHRQQPVLELLAHQGFSLPHALRAAVLASMDAPQISTAELARLNWRLGIAYADAVKETLAKHPATLDLIGCHGQTVYHQGAKTSYAGRRFACTLQLGEPALLAKAHGVPVVSNFRPADMAAEGQGAPLVPLLDYTCFRHPRRARVLQNIGGIGNLTCVPAASTPEDVLAFDTGPGNMVIDACMQRLFDKRYDRAGRVAALGEPLERVLSPLLRERFFSASPPKSAGREQFGEAYVDRFLAACRKVSSRDADIIATATALTARSITVAMDRFVLPTITGEIDYVLSGGGAHNATLIGMLREALELRGATILESGQLGLPVEAKESAAFALLAYYTWHMRPGNILSATGAARPALLGSITYA